MAKGFKATWLGDGDPSSQLITEGGIRFIKGEEVSVPSDLTFNGMPWADTIRSNPTFSVGDHEEVVDAGEEDEIAEVKAELDAKGIKYHHKAGLTTLRGLLASAD